MRNLEHKLFQLRIQMTITLWIITDIACQFGMQNIFAYVIMLYELHDFWKIIALVNNKIRFYDQNVPDFNLLPKVMWFSI